MISSPGRLAVKSPATRGGTIASNLLHDGTALNTPAPTRWAAGTAFIWYPVDRLYLQLM